MLDPLRRVAPPAAAPLQPLTHRPGAEEAPAAATDRRQAIGAARGQVPAVAGLALAGDDVAADVERLYQATLGRRGTDETAVLAILASRRTPEARQALQAAFQARHGQSVESVINAEMSLTYRERALSLMTTGADRNDLSSWAYRLEGALDTVDTIGTVFQEHPIMAGLATAGGLVVARRAPVAMAMLNYGMLASAGGRLVANEVEAATAATPAARREALQGSGRAAADVALSLPGSGRSGARLVSGGARAAGGAWRGAEESSLLVRAWRSAAAGATYRPPTAAAVARASAAAAVTTEAANGVDATAMPRQLLSQFVQTSSPQELLTRMLRVGQSLSPEQIASLSRTVLDPTFVAANRGEKLARVLSAMGPAHTKLGQVAATQPGLPQDITTALGRLQDSLQPMSDVDLTSRMTSAGLTGRYEVGRVLGVASMGQVNEARNLLTNERVVIKFLRPGVTPEAIRSEFRFMREMAEPLLSRMSAHDAANWRQQLNSFEAGILEEADMTREAANMTEFAQTYAAHPDFRGINLVELGADSRALVMSPADGIAFKQLAAQGPDLARRAASAYLRGLGDQVFRHGLYHADPHPGNVKFDAAAGRVEFMDMGAVARVSAADRLQMQRMVLFVLAKDARRIASQVVANAERVEGPAAEAVTRYAQALEGYLNQPGFRMAQIDDHMQAIDRLAHANGIIPQQQGFWLTKTLITSYGVFRNLSGDPNVLRQILPAVMSGLLNSFRENPASLGPTLREVCGVLGTRTPTFLASLRELRVIEPGLFARFPQDFLTALDALAQAELAGERIAAPATPAPVATAQP